MKRPPLYSRSRPPAAAGTQPDSPSTAATSSTAPPPPRSRRFGRIGAFFSRHVRPTWLVATLALVAAALLVQHVWTPTPLVLTQKDIDAAVRATLEKSPLPSAYAKAYEAIRPSVVRVTGLSDDDDDDKPEASPKPGRKGQGADQKADKGTHKGSDKDAHQDELMQHARSTGSGVVIVDNGTILTNLHVVVGSKRLRVTFADGHESEATLVGAQPEHDLAVLRAKSIPDDLVAATMTSTASLAPGDEVLAVGYPFGIGPSASGGIVSGLKRQFRSPDGERLNNLIQFDAAANPGNSGGPLVTMDGSVVGIVTAILNPGEARTFIGIGFAVPIENAAAAAGMPPF